MAKYVQPNFIVDSSAAFLRNVSFDSSVYLKGTTHISSPATAGVALPYALTVDTIGANVQIKSKLLGSMAFEASTNYYGKTQVDNIITTVNASISRIDASLNDVIDAATLFPSIAYVDGSLNAKVNKAGDTMTGLLTLASAGFTLDGQNITAIDTSAEGFGVGLDTHIPTSALVKAAIEAAVSATTADNGLHEQPNGNIQLGGALIHDTSIDFNGQSLYFAGIGASATSLNVLIHQTDNNIKTRELGTMALEATGTYLTKAQIDASFGVVWTKLGNVDTSLNSVWTKFSAVDTSLTNLGTKNANQDTSINGIWTKLGSVDTSLNGIWTKFGSVDTSLANLGIKDAQIDASIVRIDLYQGVQDASISAALAGTTRAFNGLTRLDNSIGLGGSLSLPETTIATNGATNTLRITNLATSTSDTPFALVSDVAGEALKVRQLGSMAWATTTNYTLKSLFDSSVAAIWTKFGSVDTSLANLGIKDAAIDTSLNGIWTKLGYVDSSMATMNTWNLNQDASIAAISSAQGLYVLKTGDTMTGPLAITGGGLTVGTTVAPLDASFFGDVTVKNHLHVGGNLQVDGSLIYTNIQSINVSTGFIQLSTGITGAPPSTLQSGIIVNRGTADPYIFVYDENSQTFRVGISTLETSTHYKDSSTQAVATRQDAPVVNGISYWNNNSYSFDTSAGFTFTPGVGLSLPVAPTQAAEMTVLTWNGSAVGSRDLNTMAFEVSTNYYGKTQVDALLLPITGKNTDQDASIVGLRTSITDLSTNKLDAVASTTGVTGHDVYSSEASNIAYIKKIVAGAGTTITSDSSVITIAVGGTTGVQKYKGTFDGTASSPFAVTAATHGLGTGPFTISVYESNELVYTGLQVDGVGNVSISWAPGSLLDASCKFIITG